MSFDIQLGYTESPRNKVSKVFHSYGTLSGTLKNETSILNPTIIMRNDDSVSFNADTIPVTKCNYMYISNFHRYYYIVDFQSIRNSVFEIVGKVDPLKTFESEILSNTGYILRSASRSNVTRYLDDDKIKIYANPHVVTKKLTGETFAKNPTFILAVSGGGGGTSS